MPAKSKSPAGELELATLAATFLPKIEFPPDWQQMDYASLTDAIGKPTGNTPGGHGVQLPEKWRTAWEVACKEAVTRAKVLIDAAGGRSRPAVLQFEAEATAARTQQRMIDAEAVKLRQTFTELAGGKDRLPITKVLKFCLPGSREDTLMYYLRSYLLEDETARNKRNGKADAPVIGDQSGRMVDRKEFPQFVMGFRDALRLRRTAWQKARLRKGGEVGGNQTQAAKAAKQKEAKRRDAEEVTVPALTSRDSGRLSEADSRRSRKK